MTKEEAIKYIRFCMCEGRLVGNTKPIIDEKWQAGLVAIEALKHEPKKGHWKERRNRATGHIETVCSECGAEEGYPYNDYCGNCGAQMFEQQEFRLK